MQLVFRPDRIHANIIDIRELLMIILLSFFIYHREGCVAIIMTPQGGRGVKFR